MPLRAHIPGGETDLSLNSDDPEWAGMGSNAWPSYKALGKFFSETQFPYLQSGDNDTNSTNYIIQPYKWEYTSKVRQRLWKQVPES